MVKLDSILNTDCYYLTKIVATQLQRHGYASLSKFFKNLPQSDLDILLDKIFVAGNNQEEFSVRARRNADLALLAMTLALAEGKVECTPEDVAQLTRRIILLVHLANIDRQGKGKANYDLFSLTDIGNDAIFETIKGANQ